MSQYFAKDVLESNDDHIYYNIALTNNTDVAIPAKFQQSRTDTIVQNPNEYYLSVVRFLLPTSSIPIFEFEDGTYSITFSATVSNKTYTQQSFVLYINPVVSYDISNRNIYTYESFIHMINVAFATGLLALNKQITDDGKSVITYNPPFLKFDPVTKLITLYAEIAGYLPEAQSTGQTPVIIWLNTKLFQFLSSFSNFYNGSSTSINPLATDGKNYQLLLNISENIVPGVVPPIIYIVHVSASNNKIDFKEGGGAQLTGTIASPVAGYYNSMTDLCNAIQTAMNTAPGVTYTFGVYWDFVTHKVNIFSYNGAFTLLFGTGTNVATSIAPFIGFLNNDDTSTPGLGVANRVTADTTTGVFDAISSVQEYNTLFAWNELRSISFTTTTIPVQHEYLPGTNPNSGLQIFSSVLTDFQINVSDAPEARSFIQYIPSAEYRLVSLGGTTPLKIFDMNAQWVDNLQVSHQIYLPPYQSMTMKLLFRRKIFNLGYNPVVSYSNFQKELEFERERKEGRGIKQRKSRQ